MFLKNLLGPLLSKLYTSNTCYAEKIQYVLAGFTWLWSWKMCHFYLEVTRPNAFVSLVRHQILGRGRKTATTWNMNACFQLERRPLFFTKLGFLAVIVTCLSLVQCEAALFRRWRCGAAEEKACIVQYIHGTTRRWSENYTQGTQWKKEEATNT